MLRPSARETFVVRQRFGLTAKLTRSAEAVLDNLVSINTQPEYPHRRQKRLRVDSSGFAEIFREPFSFMSNLPAGRSRALCHR